MGTSARVAPPAGLALLLALAAAGCARTGPTGSPPAAATPVASSPAAADSFESSRTYAVPGAPVRIRIPAIGVDSTLDRVRRAADGTMGLPVRPERAAWWQEGPRPGQRGPAVILGHVDWQRRPAVFHRLGELRLGDTVLVDRAGGGTGRFRVTGARQVAKDRFPTELVYAPTLQPSLRLITCGGDVRPSGHGYQDNVIVFAVPA